MAIPLKLEELILEGKAKFETFQAGFTELSVIPVGTKEFIVVTGLKFQPANRARYEGALGSFTTVQRIELHDGKNYNHFVAKMGGNVAVNDNSSYNDHSYQNLYCIFKSDVGVMVTVPQAGPIDLTAFRDDLTGANGNTAKKIVNQGTNPYLLTPQNLQYQTEGGSAGTLNIPTNVKVNGPNYSNNFAAGPYAGQ